MEVNKYSIRFTPKAYEDLIGINSYITNDLYNEVLGDGVSSNLNGIILNHEDFSIHILRLINLG
jgi:hypothetical protein